MPKRLNVQAPKSPFADILGRHIEAHGEVPTTALNIPMPVPTSRKLGKSADPAYTKLTAYIRKETHQVVKIRLLQEGQGREFSELVQELLDSWVRGGAV